jgi:hypothetical protein
VPSRDASTLALNTTPGLLLYKTPAPNPAVCNPSTQHSQHLCASRHSQCYHAMTMAMAMPLP